MAKEKELVFSSEREEKQGQLKRILILAGIVLGVIILVVGAALIVRSTRAVVHTGGEDTPYPYTWKNSKGSMIIEIDRSADPDRVWQAYNVDNVNSKCETPEKQPKDKNQFVFTPKEEGRYSIIFILMGADDQASMRMEMFVESKLDANGVLESEVLSTSLLARQVLSEGGEGTNYPYSYLTDTDGFLVVTIAGAAACGDWDCVSDNENVALPAGVFMDGDDAVFYIQPGSERGMCTLKLYRTAIEVSLQLGVELTEGNGLIVTSDKLTGGDIEAAAVRAEGELTPEEIEKIGFEEDAEDTGNEDNESGESSEGED